jgi:pyridoxine kinase
MSRPSLPGPTPIRPGAPAAALPAVLVISSHVVRGSVGGRAAFVLEQAGYRVWSLPTVVLPWHPGHGRAHRIAPDPDDFAALCGDLSNSPRLGEIGAVLTGYLGSAGQAEPIARLIKAVRTANPAAVHVADPVVGDENGPYVPADIAAAQRDVLVPLADIATPNRFELAQLTGRSTETMAGLVAAARAFGPPRVLVTSAPAMMRGRIAVALVEQERVVMAENPLVHGAPSGTGDLFAALYLARSLAGASDESALEHAVAATFEMVVQSVRADSGELELAAAQDVLRRPSSAVDVRTFAEPRRPEPLP